MGVIPVARSKWSEEEKLRAVALAQQTSVREAVKATGIPLATIGRWLSERNKASGTEQPERNRTPKKLEALAEQATQAAVAEVKDYIVDRLKALADELYALAENGVRETRQFMASPKAKDRDSAAWLRAVVGAMHYGILDAQLLSGKPTARPEVTSRYEYDITQRIIADPEALDLAETLLRRAAGRDTGALRLHGERGSVDTV